MPSDNESLDLGPRLRGCYQEPGLGVKSAGKEERKNMHYLLYYCSTKIVVDDLIVTNVIIMLE